jgi:hypothetical protein
MGMIRMRRVLAALALFGAVAQPALAQNYPNQNFVNELTPTPVIEGVGQRYILMVLDQADRNLDIGSSKINVLVDTRTGKTWILDYTVKPNSNERGFVWSEIPFAKAPQ